MQFSTGALLAAYSSGLHAEASPADISNQNESVQVTGADYSWEYSQKTIASAFLTRRNG